MITSLFNLRPHEVRTTPGLHSHLKLAGITHLEVGFIPDQADLDWCAKHGFRVIAQGDGVMRTDGDWKRHGRKGVVQEQARKLRGICDGIEMVDECKQSPSMYYPRAGLFRWWWADADGPPMAWPGFLTVDWESTLYADYSSRQWNWRTSRNGQERLDRLRISLDYPRPFKELSALICAVGPYYSKRKPGGEYQKGDVLWNKGPSGQNIVKQIALARKLGATRLRIYAWDWKLWKDQRKNAPTDGSVECQTGISLVDHRWAMMAEAIRGVTHARTS